MNRYASQNFNIRCLNRSVQIKQSTVTHRKARNFPGKVKENFSLGPFLEVNVKPFPKQEKTIKRATNLKTTNKANLEPKTTRLSPKSWPCTAVIFLVQSFKLSACPKSDTHKILRKWKRSLVFKPIYKYYKLKLMGQP